MDGLSSYVNAQVEFVIREEWPKLMAVLYRDLGNLELAEDAAQEAATLALTRWLDDGIPDRPGAWITTVARRKALDVIRRERLGKDKTVLLHRLEGPLDGSVAAPEDPTLKDDQLRLFFGCCHPALSVEAQVALTLRSIGGLTTAEIAKCFLISESTMAQRIVRAKRKIATAGIPFRIPNDDDLPARLSIVHHVLYLVFNEGSYPSSGDRVTRLDLSSEALRLTRLLADVMADDSETVALAALMLFGSSRGLARTSADGDPILLKDQDRALWNRSMIAEATSMLDRSFELARSGPYQIEAAIEATYAQAECFAETDWHELVLLYRALYRVRPSPVVALNLAVVTAEAEGPAVGLALIDGEEDLLGQLSEYPYLYSTRGELLARLGLLDEAKRNFEEALARTSNAADRRFLETKIREC